MALRLTDASRRLPGWLPAGELPREARDTLFLLGVIAWVLVPHLPHRPWWCTALAAGVLTWRAALALRSAPLPGRLPVAGVLVVSGALTFSSEGTLLGREPGITLLVVLMALKTLELRARRDATVALFLGFFLVLTQFLYSQSMATAVGAVLGAWGLLTALALAHLPGPRPALRRAAAVTARAALLGVPVMVVLFLLFPRLGPLWGLPQDASGRTGLSGTMRMGELAQLARDDSVALRVRFAGRVPGPQSLYFRGPVLSEFDGREWTRPPGALIWTPEPAAGLEVYGEPVDYEIMLEPDTLTVLPTLELTRDRRGEAPVLAGHVLVQHGDLSWNMVRPLSERTRYSARAWPEHRHGQRARALALREQVALPAGYNPRALEWAAALRRDPRYAQAGGTALADALLQHLRSQGFRYTLEPGSYGRHAVDEFWFDRREGFCEHFAAAFVVMMRALDVPARVVVGYQGTDLAPVDGWWVVRRSHAHAWAEYWDAAQGWVRADPTAAAAPARIGASRQLERSPGFMAATLEQLSPELLTRLGQWVELLEVHWNRNVLNFSRGSQYQLLRELGFSSPDSQHLLRLLGSVVVAVALLGAAWAWRGRRHLDPWVRLQRRVAVRLQRLGVPVNASEPPRARAAQVRARLGARGEPLAQALEALERLRYAPPPPGAPPAPARLPAKWWAQFERAARTVGPGRP